MSSLRAWFARLRSGLSPLSLLLVVASIYVAALGLKEVARGVETSLLVFMILYGVATGLLLAALNLAGWSGGILSGSLGALLILSKVGRIGPQLQQLAGSALALSGQVWYRPVATQAQLERVQALSQAWIEFREVAAIPIGRTYRWAAAWVAGEPGFDPVAVALLWSALFWGISVWAGWMISARRQPLVALAPAIALLGAGMGSIGAKPQALLWSLGIALPTMALVAQDVRAERWQRERIRYAAGIGRRLALWALLLSALLVFAAAVSHAFSVERVVRYVNRLRLERAGQSELARQALGLEQQQAAEPILPADLARLHVAGLPRRQLIGAGPELSEQLALVVRLPESPRGPSFEAGVPVERYYWRSTTYDRYTGRGWRTADTSTSDYSEGALIVDPIPDGYQPVDQIVRTVPELGGLLFQAGDLVTVDHPFTVDWRSNADPFGAVLTTPGTSARIQSLVLAADPERLRANHATYPDWILQRYLQIPPGVPDRVLALARDLTATSPTPYDRALVIESYLRSFEYTLELEAPPPGRDIVDYFLFDLQRGYCDYFASSMVILARAAGLPARLVVGYASGQYDTGMRAFLVTEADAHSWPEVYFPDVGWVEFEPTSGRPELRRQPVGSGLPEGLQQSAQELESDQQGGPPVDWTGWLGRARELAFPTLVGLLLLGLIWGLVVRRRESRQSEGQLVAGLYAELKRKAAALGFLTESGATPNELAAAVGAGLQGLARGALLQPGLAPGVAEARALVDHYVGLSYRNRLEEGMTRVSALRSWRRLSWRLRLAQAGMAFRGEAKNGN